MFLSGYAILNMNIMWIAVLLALTIAGACFRLLRKLTRPQVSSEDLNAWIDINWQSCSPLERLLDPAEFEFLQKRGLSKQRIRGLRAKRRGLFRMYLRRLTNEFNMADAALRTVLVTTGCDRPNLARELARQRVLFYRGLIGVELRLTLNAMGFDSVPVPSLDLIRPLERLHLEFCNLVPDMSAAAA
jgi:hypothetical protein